MTPKNSSYTTTLSVITLGLSLSMLNATNTPLQRSYKKREEQYHFLMRWLGYYSLLHLESDFIFPEDTNCKVLKAALATLEDALEKTQGAYDAGEKLARELIDDVKKRKSCTARAAKKAQYRKRACQILCGSFVPQPQESEHSDLCTNTIYITIRRIQLHRGVANTLLTSHPLRTWKCETSAILRGLVFPVLLGRYMEYHLPSCSQRVTRCINAYFETARRLYRTLPYTPLLRHITISPQAKNLGETCDKQTEEKPDPETVDDYIHATLTACAQWKLPAKTPCTENT